MTTRETMEAGMKDDLASMREDMRDLKESVSKIADAVTKLAILEDRQSAQNNVIDKIVTRMEKIEERNHSADLRLERLETTGGNVSNGIKAFWAVFGGALVTAFTWIFTHPTVAK